MIILFKILYSLPLALQVIKETHVQRFSSTKNSRYYRRFTDAAIRQFHFGKVSVIDTVMIFEAKQNRGFSISFESVARQCSLFGIFDQDVYG